MYESDPNPSSWRTEDNYVNRIRFSNINSSIRGMIGKKKDTDKTDICIDYDEDGENLYLRKETLKLVEYGNELWGVNNWNWSVTKQELDYVDFNASKFCAGAASFVEIKLKGLDIIRENCGYASCYSKRKGMAIQKARRNATTNALLETFLSFGGDVAMGIPRASKQSIQQNKRITVQKSKQKLSPADTTTVRSATSPSRLAGAAARYSSSITLDIKPKRKRSLYPKQDPRREYSSSTGRGSARRPPSWYPLPPKPDASELSNVPPKTRSPTPPQYAAARASRPLAREERPLDREERPLAREERLFAREERPLAREERPFAREERPSDQQIDIRRSIDLNKLTLNTLLPANQDVDYRQSANIRRKPSWHDLAYDRPISPSLITDDGTLRRDMYPLYDIPTRDNTKIDALAKWEEKPREKPARAPSYAGSYHSPSSPQPKRPTAKPLSRSSKQSRPAPKTLQQSPSRSENRSNTKSAYRPVTKPERRSITDLDHRPITDRDHRSITDLDHRSITNPVHRSITDRDNRSITNLDHHSTKDHERHSTNDNERHSTNDNERHSTNDPARHSTNDPARHSTNDHERHATNDHERHSTNDHERQSTKDHERHATNDHERHSTKDHERHSTPDPDHRSFADLDHHSTTDPTHKYERSSKMQRSRSPPISDTEKFLSFDDFTTPKKNYSFSRTAPEPCYNKMCGQPYARKLEKLSRAFSPFFSSNCDPCKQLESACPGSCKLPDTCSGVPCNKEPCQPSCKLNCKLLWDQDSPEYAGQTTLYKPYRICSFDECASGYCLLMTTGVDCTPRSMRPQSPAALPPPDSNVENPDKDIEEGNVEEMTEDEVRAERKRRQRQAQEESAIQLDRNKKTFYWPEGLKRSRRSGKRLRKRSMRLIWRGVSGTSRRESKLAAATSYTF